MKNLIIRLLFLATIMPRALSQNSTFSKPKDWDMLCPYSNICNHKAAMTNVLPRYKKPCCDSCSCDEDCGLYKNCCQYSLDKYRLDETYNTKCTSLSTYDHDNDKQLYVSNMYTIIDQCPDSISCYDFNVTTIGSMYPVVSVSTKMIYLNKICAYCHGVSDAIFWEMELNCKSDTMNNLRIKEDLDEFLKKYLKSEMCNIRFLPPSSIDLKFQRCTIFPIVRKCLQETDDKDTSLMCSSYNSTYSYLISKYANVHCFLCSSSLNVEHVCDDDDQIKVSPFSAILTPRDISTIDKTTHDGTTCQGRCICKNNEVADMKSGSCRRVYCPVAMLQIGEKCSNVPEEVLAGPFVTFLRLEIEGGLQGIYPRDLNYLGTQRIFPCKLQGWYQSVFVPTNNDFVNYMIVRLIHPRAYMNMTSFFKEFKTSLDTPWHIYDKTDSFKLKASFHKYFDYIHCKTSNESIFIPRSSERNNPVCDEVEINDEESLKPIYIDTFINLPNTYSKLTKFYFCKHVDLYPDEYEMHYKKMFFKVKNQSYEEIEYRRIPSEDGESIALCMSEFGENFWLNFNSSKRMCVHHMTFCILFFLSLEII